MACMALNDSCTGEQPLPAPPFTFKNVTSLMYLWSTKDGKTGALFDSIFIKFNCFATASLFQAFGYWGSVAKRRVAPPLSEGGPGGRGGQWRIEEFVLVIMFALFSLRSYGPSTLEEDENQQPLHLHQPPAPSWIDTLPRPGKRNSMLHHPEWMCTFRATTSVRARTRQTIYHAMKCFIPSIILIFAPFITTVFVVDWLLRKARTFPLLVVYIFNNS